MYALVADNIAGLSIFELTDL